MNLQLSWKEEYGIEPVIGVAVFAGLRLVVFAAAEEKLLSM